MDVRYKFHSKMTAEQVFAVMHVTSSHYDIMSTKPGVMSVRYGRDKFRLACQRTNQLFGSGCGTLALWEFDGRVMDMPGGACIRGCFRPVRHGCL